MADEDEPRRPTRTDLAVSAVALVSLALAEPVLGLLGASPTFFTARASPRLDIFILALVLGVALPLLVAGVLVALDALHHATATAAHAALLVVLGAALTLILAKRAGVAGLPVWASLPLSLFAGVALWYAYHRLTTVRAMFRYLAAAPVVVAGVFLFLAPTAQLAWPPGATIQPIDAAIGNPVPVVMVVLDEFPIASIMNDGGTIQADYFPGFARLAEDSTWYRNAAGVLQGTEQAIPSIVSGVISPLEGKVPRAADYPKTIFTLLGGPYRVHAVETVTELCPSYVCSEGSRARPSFSRRWRSLLGDLAVVYGHLLLPADLEQRLPPVDQTWGNFTSPSSTLGASEWDMRSRMRANVEADRRVPVSRLLDMVDHPLQPGDLVFAHLLLPHSGWNFLPDGRRNGSAECSSCPRRR